MNIGYQDTPFIPGTRWHVHDGERPQPRVVAPGDLSTREPVKPPSDAVILFDGTSMEEWESVNDGGPASWNLVDGGAMEVVKGAGNIRTKRRFGDIQLHVEWSAPSIIKGEGQGRGNSGVFLMGLYEIQVLDSWENPTYPDGSTAAIYGQFPPMVNACCKPGEWHVYDVIWQCPRFHADTCLLPPSITVLHNGVLVHHSRELLGPTKHRLAPMQEPHPPVGPVMLQDHGDPVRFRNIWAREI